MHNIAGMEVFMQAALQVALLLLTNTKTATIGGLETFFSKEEMFWIKMEPDKIIIISVIWKLISSTLLHVKILGMEKGLFDFKAALYQII